MQDINTTTITGRVASETPLHRATKGTSYTEFRVAVNDRMKAQDGTYTDRANFIPVKIWNGLAEVCAAHLVKGQAVTVTGKLRQESWGEGEDRKSRVYVVAEQIVFGAKPKNAGQPEQVVAGASE